MNGKAQNLLNKAQSIAEDKADLIKFGVYLVSIMLIILLFVWSYTKFSLKDSNCEKIAKDNTSNSKINDLVMDDGIFDGHQSTDEITKGQLVGEYKLRDFVVKTAYNCCATGGFSHDYVGLCASVSYTHLTLPTTPYV